MLVPHARQSHRFAIVADRAPGRQEHLKIALGVYWIRIEGLTSIRPGWQGGLTRPSDQYLRLLDSALASAGRSGRPGRRRRQPSPSKVSSLAELGFFTCWTWRPMAAPQLQRGPLPPPTPPARTCGAADSAAASSPPKTLQVLGQPVRRRELGPPGGVMVRRAWRGGCGVRLRHRGGGGGSNAGRAAAQGQHGQGRLPGGEGEGGLGCLRR